ncbi:hypothetical protein D3C77_732970 [compost metagenome]
MTQALDAWHHFGKSRFIDTAAAKVLADGCGEGVLVREQHVSQAFQPLQALRCGRHGVTGKSLTLDAELGVEVIKGARG